MAPLPWCHVWRLKLSSKYFHINNECKRCHKFLPILVNQTYFFQVKQLSNDSQFWITSCLRPITSRDVHSVILIDQTSVLVQVASVMVAPRRCTRVTTPWLASDLSPEIVWLLWQCLLVPWITSSQRQNLGCFATWYTTHWMQDCLHLFLQEVLLSLQATGVITTV